MKSLILKTKSLCGQSSYVGHSNLIHGSTQIRYLYVGLVDSNVKLFMYLVKGVRFGTCRPNVSFFFSNSMYSIPESISDMQFC